MEIGQNPSEEKERLISAYRSGQPNRERRGGVPEAQVARGCRKPGISQSRTENPGARCPRKGLPVELRSAFFTAGAAGHAGQAAKKPLDF